MALQDLSLPVDIPWRLVATSTDMLASHDDPFPHATWRSSLAVFAYDPDLSDLPEDFPDRELTYLKVVCSITSYAPGCVHPGLDRQHAALYTNTRNKLLESLLEQTTRRTYPCSGALVQVAVYPKQDIDRNDVTKLAYITAIEPQKRELIEVVTESGETLTQSRNATNVRKGVTSTDSTEDLDVLTGVNVSAGYGGAQASVGVSGQWGTIKRSSQENVDTTTTDSSREAREQQSHTTSLSQLYHVLSSYHVGTNRALFFLQPRPHTNTLKDRLTFINGPQEIEGIQEFFVIVNRPKGVPIDSYCVDAQLYTAHLDDDVARLAIQEPKTLETPWSEIWAMVAKHPDPADPTQDWWKFLIPIPIPGINDPVTLMKDAAKTVDDLGAISDQFMTDLNPPSGVQIERPAMLKQSFTAPAGWKIDRTRGMGGYDLWEDPDNLTHVPWSRGNSKAPPRGFVDIDYEGTPDDIDSYRADTQLTLSAQVFPGKDDPGVYHARLKIYFVRDDLPNQDRAVDMFVTVRGISTCSDSTVANLYNEKTVPGDRAEIAAESALPTLNAAPVTVNVDNRQPSVLQTLAANASNEVVNTLGFEIGRPSATASAPAASTDPVATAGARAKMANALSTSVRGSLKSTLACKNPLAGIFAYRFIESDFVFRKLAREALRQELPGVNPAAIGGEAARYVAEHPEIKKLATNNEALHEVARAAAKPQRTAARTRLTARTTAPAPKSIANAHQFPVLFLQSATLTSRDRQLLANANLHSALDLLPIAGEALAGQLGTTATEARALRLRALGFQVP